MSPGAWRSWAPRRSALSWHSDPTGSQKLHRGPGGTKHLSSPFWECEPRPSMVTTLVNLVIWISLNVTATVGKKIMCDKACKLSNSCYTFGSYKQFYCITAINFLSLFTCLTYWWLTVQFQVIFIKVFSLQTQVVARTLFIIARMRPKCSNVACKMWIYNILWQQKY